MEKTLEVAADKEPRQASLFHITFTAEKIGQLIEVIDAARDYAESRPDLIHIRETFWGGAWHNCHPEDVHSSEPVESMRGPFVEADENGIMFGARDKYADNCHFSDYITRNELEEMLSDIRLL
jgi:hypothetical protein